MFLFPPKINYAFSNLHICLIRSSPVIFFLSGLYSGVDPIKLFSSLTKNFSFFTVKLGHFITNDFFSICNNHWNLTAKVGKWRKKFYRIEYWIVLGRYRFCSYCEQCDHYSSLPGCVWGSYWYVIEISFRFCFYSQNCFNLLFETKTESNKKCHLKKLYFCFHLLFCTTSASITYLLREILFPACVNETANCFESNQ